MKKILLIVIFGLFLITSIQAMIYTPHSQFQNLTFSITSNFANECILTDINYPLGVLPINQTGVNSDKTFTFFIDGGNYSVPGVYSHNLVCFDGLDSITGYEIRQVTASGQYVSGVSISAYIFLFLFLFSILAIFYYITKNINYEKWYSSIIQKWEDKNIVRVIISSIGFNLMKNSFIWYYLFGLPVILLITDITYIFGVYSMIEIMKVVLMIYYFGLLLVGVFFFGLLIEWVKNIVKDIEEIGWGIK